MTAPALTAPVDEAPAATAARDVVFTFSYETYADSVHRGMMRPPDRILQTLLAAPEVGGMLVANPFRSYASLLKSRLVGDREPSFPGAERRRLVTPRRLRRRDPQSLPAIVRAYREYDRRLARAAEETGLVAPAVVTTNPLAAAFCPFGWASTVTYFGRDDWLSSGAHRAQWPAYAAAYRQIADSEVGVAAVSQQIIDRIAPRGPSVVVPNGVDPAEWLGPRPAAPDWLADIPEPRAIYVGTIDDRLDAAALIELAAARPKVRIVLLGPVTDPALVAAFDDVPTIHVHPGVGRAGVVAALRHSQVALLAHRRTPLTEAMSPLKVYEYLAAGLPVLATDLPPVRGLHEAVLLSSDLPAALDEALARGPLAEADREAFISRNSWSARHGAVLDLVLRSPLLHAREDLVRPV